MDEQELQEKLRAIIKSPMRSKISTADIAVGMWSSTMLSEKIGDLMQLLTQYGDQRELAGRIDELEKLYLIERGDTEVRDDRLAELKQKQASKEDV